MATGGGASVDPVTLIKGPPVAPSWYRCPSCGTRQRGPAAPPVGGIECESCRATLRVEQQIAFASLTTRALALLADASAMLALWIIVAMPTGAFTPYDANGNVTPHGRLAARLVYVVLTVGYFWIGESLGQTVGKRVVGIRVVVAHSWGRPGVYRGLARVLLGGVSLLALGAGFALIPFDHEGRAFHDRVTGTRVIER